MHPLTEKPSEFQMLLRKYQLKDHWFLIALSYSIYCVFFAYGGYSAKHWPNYLGFCFFFLPLLFLPKYPRNVNWTFIASVILVALPIMEMLCGINDVLEWIAYIKQSSIFLLYIVLYYVKLKPVNSSKSRGVFVACILFFMALSFAMGKTYTGDSERLKGIFQSPNSLLLVVFGLLFFLNEKDPKVIKIITHSVIVVFCVLTSTLGGIMGYGSCMVFKYKSKILTRRYLLLAIGLMASLAVFWIVGGAIFSKTMLGHRIFASFSALNDNYSDAFSDKVDYGRLAPEYGGQNLSGVWRIMHWGRIWKRYYSSGPLNWVCGMGIGYSRANFALVPHNDYLRILTEQGLLGFSLYLVFFISLYRKIPPPQRYPTIAFFVYCISENNLDTFVYLALLVFYFSGYENQFSFLKSVRAHSGKSGDVPKSALQG